MRNEQIMSRPAITCSASDALDVAAKKMWEYDCGVLPVADSEGKLCGVLTDRDICMAAYTKNMLLRDIPIRDVMTRDVVRCGAGDNVHVSEQLMRMRQVRRIPIVDVEERILGVLSMNDIARRAARTPNDDVSEHEVVDTLAAICQPRSLPSPRAAAV
jgi:CBS domain-containing protein